MTQLTYRAVATALLVLGSVRLSAADAHTGPARLHPTTFTCPEDDSVWTRVCVFKDLTIIDGAVTYLYSGLSAQLAAVPGKHWQLLRACLQVKDRSCLRSSSKCPQTEMHTRLSWT